MKPNNERGRKRKVMKRLRWILLAIALAILAIFLPSYTAAEIHGRAEVGFFSQYIGGMTGSTIFDKPVLQQSIELSMDPLGIYGKIWNSYSSKGGWNNGDYGDEIDYALGIRKSVGEWNFDIGYALYDMYKVGRIEGDLHALYGWMGFPKIYCLAPFVSLEWDIPTDKEILKGGVVYRSGLLYSTSKILEQPINMELSIAGHDDAYGHKAEFISSSRIGISMPIKIWKLSLIPKINFQKRLGRYVKDGGMTEDKIWGGAVISYSF